MSICLYGVHPVNQALDSDALSIYKELSFVQNQHTTLYYYNGVNVVGRSVCLSVITILQFFGSIVPKVIGDLRGSRLGVTGGGGWGGGWWCTLPPFFFWKKHSWVNKSRGWSGVG